jgi:cysteine synthase B
MGTSTYLKEKTQPYKSSGHNPVTDPKFRASGNGLEYLPKIFNPAKVDRIVEVSEQEARA